MTNPRVSVVIPSYNVGRYLQYALQSVLAQDYHDYEVVVIDDGSTDNTREVVATSEIPIRYYYQKNTGISGARNAGIAQARGEYIAFLDADDVWTPTKLSEQVSHLDGHPEIGMVFSLAQNTLDPTKDESDYPIIPAHVPPNCTFRRDILDTVGMFDETIKLGEFADWYARAIGLGVKVYCIPKLLIRRRIHGENMGIKHKINQIDYVRILKRKIDRDRVLQSIEQPDE